MNKTRTRTVVLANDFGNAGAYYGTCFKRETPRKGTPRQLAGGVLSKPKLSDEQKAQLKAFRKQGHKYDTLAKMFKVSVSLAFEICNK